MTKKNVKKDHLAGEYREESPKPAILVTLVVVLLIAAPLTLANLKIEEQGAQAADVSEYASLASRLTEKIAALHTIIEQGVLEDAALQDNAIVVRNVQFIVPDLPPTNAVEGTTDPNAMTFRLSGIYYPSNSTQDPICTIDGEEKHEGDTVKGFRIMEIRRQSVILRSPTGETVIKKLYEYDTD